MLISKEQDRFKIIWHSHRDGRTCLRSKLALDLIQAAKGSEVVSGIHTLRLTKDENQMT